MFLSYPPYTCPLIRPRTPRNSKDPPKGASPQVPFATQVHPVLPSHPSLLAAPPLRGLKFVIRALHPLDVIHYDPVIQGDPPRPGISHSQQSASRLTAHLPHNSFHLRPQSLAFHTKWCSCLNLNLMSQWLGWGSPFLKRGPFKWALHVWGV